MQGLALLGLIALGGGLIYGGMLLQSALYDRYNRGCLGTLGDICVLGCYTSGVFVAGMGLIVGIWRIGNALGPWLGPFWQWLTSKG